MVGLIGLAFVLGDIAAIVLLSFAGAVMLVGRFWWPADVVRQVVWRYLEPAGVLERHEAHEDRATRRIARVIGGASWLVSAALLLLGVAVLAWGLAFAIAFMVALDAAFDFCALCWIVSQLEQRRWMPARVARVLAVAAAGER